MINKQWIDYHSSIDYFSTNNIQSRYQDLGWITFPPPQKSNLKTSRNKKYPHTF